MEQRREKAGLFMGDARLKATTPHSFKGWETRMLVVYVSQFKSPESRGSHLRRPNPPETKARRGSFSDRGVLG